MTRELKNLMDRATDRPDLFIPDAAKLVAAGRRRVRNRRVVGSIATLVMLFAGITVAIDLQDTQGAEPAGTPTPGRPQDAYKLCTTSNGTALADEAWSWDEVLASTDEYGSASIRKSPGKEYPMYAFCITQRVFAVGVPTGGRGGILLRKSPIDRTRSVTTVFGRAYGEQMRVLVDTGDRKSGEGVAKSDFFVYRHVEARSWPSVPTPMPMAIVRIYDANGRLSALGRW